MNLKYNIVTAVMIWEALEYEDHEHDVVNKGRQIECQILADKLNKLINERCPYCEEGKKGCHCWNDD